MKITIDVSDWLTSYKCREPNVRNEDAILKQLQQPNTSTPETVRDTIIAREIGDANKDVLPPNKTLLQIGGVQVVLKRAQQRTQGVMTKKGETYQVRELVAETKQHPENPDHGIDVTQGTSVKPVFVSYKDKAAKERASQYLLNVVPGHIWNRLLILSQHNGDVPEMAERLKLKIDEMVNKLT